MKNYTKGTWELNRKDGSIHADKHLIAQVYGATEHNQEDNAAECLANAKLILNAPKMLGLLETFAFSSLESVPYLRQKTRNFLEEANND